MFSENYRALGLRKNERSIMLIFTIDALIVPEMEAETSSTFVTFRHFLFDQIPFYARGPWFESPPHPSINAEIVWRKRISHIKNARKFSECVFIVGTLVKVEAGHLYT